MCNTSRTRRNIPHRFPVGAPPWAMLLPAASRDPLDRAALRRHGHGHPPHLALGEAGIIAPRRAACRQCLGARAGISLALHGIPTAEQPVALLHPPFLG